MIGFRTTMRRALGHARRIGPSLGLAAMVLTSLPGMAAPVHASGQPRESMQLQGGDTAQRVQVVVNSVKVKNDRDGWARGSGELRMTSSFWRCAGTSGPCSPNGRPAAQMAMWKQSFSADDGDIKTFDHVLPMAADVVDSASASEAEGFALQAGHRYVFQVTMFEQDTLIGDFMGGIQRTLDESNNWGVGTYTLEPAGNYPDPSLPTTDLLCGGCGDIIVGDYLVSYEIRAAALPDLRPSAIRMLGAQPEDGTTGKETVCLGVTNGGSAAAGAFDLGLYVDNSLPPGGSAQVAGLAAGATHEQCLHTFLPQDGVHTMQVVVDQFRKVSETNETNNSVNDKIDRTIAGQVKPQNGPVVNAPVTNSGQTPVGSKTGVPGPTISGPSAPAEAQGDLTISAIRVRGQVPDGKDDCKDGGNDVTVVVKNGGSANAGAFAMRLKVDDAQGDGPEQTVNGLDAGKEREVKFGDVKLKKGEHTLTAIADAKGAIAEADEANNERAVTARCRDEN
jgi:hypothetical protein